MFLLVFLYFFVISLRMASEWWQWKWECCRWRKNEELREDFTASKWFFFWHLKYNECYILWHIWTNASMIWVWWSFRTVDISQWKYLIVLIIPFADLQIELNLPLYVNCVQLHLDLERDRLRCSSRHVHTSCILWNSHPVSEPGRKNGRRFRYLLYICLVAYFQSASSPHFSNHWSWIQKNPDFRLPNCSVSTSWQRRGLPGE